MQKINIKDPNKDAELFVHGLCALLAHDLKEKHPTLEIVSVHDFEYIFEDDDEPYEVLVHMAVKLEDGRILDGQHVFDNLEEFNTFIEEEFEEMTHFEIVSVERAEAMLKQQIENTGTFDEAFRNQKPDHHNDSVITYYDDFMNHVDTHLFAKRDDEKWIH